MQLAKESLAGGEPRVVVTRIDVQKKDDKVVALTVHYTDESRSDSVIVTMPVEFSGTIVRVEPDGFGLVQFDPPIPVGAKEVSIGVISTSGTGVFSVSHHERHTILNLKAGTRVRGAAEADDQHDTASIKTITASNH